MTKHFTRLMVGLLVISYGGFSYGMDQQVEQHKEMKYWIYLQSLSQLGVYQESIVNSFSEDVGPSTAFEFLIAVEELADFVERVVLKLKESKAQRGTTGAWLLRGVGLAEKDITICSEMAEVHGSVIKTAILELWGDGSYTRLNSIFSKMFENILRVPTKDFDKMILDLEKVQLSQLAEKLSAKLIERHSHFDLMQLLRQLVGGNQRGSRLRDRLMQLFSKQGLNINMTNAEGNTALHEAAADGDYEFVDFLISCRANLNICNADGNTPLNIVSSSQYKTNLNDAPHLRIENACMNHFKLAKLLIEAGANVNIADNTWKRSPLHAAVRDSSSLSHPGLGLEKDYVKLLIKFGAHVDAKDKDGYSPLHLAVDDNRLQMCELLLDSHADLNNTCAFGTPLCLAAQNKIADRIGIVKLLLDRGAAVRVVNENNLTPLHLLAGNGQVAGVELLLAKNADIKAVGRLGNSPLHCAAENGCREVVELLLTKGVDINCRNNAGCTALHVAAGNGHAEIVKLLLAKDADIKAVDQLGNSPLHCAAENNCREVVELLLAKGVDINCKNNAGCTALHVAAGNGHAATVKLLLAKDANIEAVDQLGNSPLHCAAGKDHRIDRNHFEVVELLLAKGVDIDCKNNAGCTSLHLAALRGNCSTIELLLKNGAHAKALDTANKRPAIQYASLGDHGAVLELFCQHDKSLLDVMDRYGRTAFHWAAIYGKMESLNTLIQLGVNVNAACSKGWSPLHWAAYYGQIEVVRVLLDLQVNPNEHDAEGGTPLHRAVEKVQTEVGGGVHVEVIKCLLRKGANINETGSGSCGKTPLHLAAEKGHRDVVELLLDNGAKIDALNKYSHTPLHNAVYYRRCEVVELLLARGANMKLNNGNGVSTKNMETSDEIKRLLEKYEK